MSNPKREGEFESLPPRRPAGPGEPEVRTDTGEEAGAKKPWKEKFPGWETYEGRPREPRFTHNEDPNRDIRYNTNLNPGMVVPKRPGLVIYLLLGTVGFLLMCMLGLAMFYHFMSPAPRSPGGPEGALHQPGIYSSVSVRPVLRSMRQI